MGLHNRSWGSHLRSEAPRPQAAILSHCDAVEKSRGDHTSLACLRSRQPFNFVQVSLSKFASIFSLVPQKLICRRVDLKIDLILVLELH